MITLTARSSSITVPTPKSESKISITKAPVSSVSPIPLVHATTKSNILLPHWVLYSHHVSLSIIFIFIFLLTPNNNHSHSITHPFIPLSSYYIYLEKPQLGWTEVFHFHTHASEPLIQKGGKSDNRTGWFHFKLTSINMKGYLTLPGRTTVFPRKCTLPVSKLTSSYRFSRFKPVTHPFSYLWHSQLKTYFIPWERSTLIFPYHTYTAFLLLKWKKHRSPWLTWTMESKCSCLFKSIPLSPV